MARGPRIPGPHPVVVSPRALQLRVDRRQLAVEPLIVIAELEELRIGELEDLERGLGADRRVVHERGAPGLHHEIIGQVRHAVAEDGVGFLIAQRLALPAQHRRDVAAARRQQIVRGPRAIELVDDVHEIIFGEVLLPIVRERRPQPVPDDPAQPLGALLEVVVLDQRLAERDELAPRAAERPRQATEMMP